MYRLVAAEARVAHGLVASSRAGRTGPPFARAVDHPRTRPAARHLGRLGNLTGPRGTARAPRRMG
jgi:hypothetical protein